MSNPFSGNSATPFGSQTSNFGQSSPGSVFGQGSSTNATQSPVFGSPGQSAQGFGQPSFPSTTQSVFGPTAQSTFGMSGPRAPAFGSGGATGLSSSSGFAGTGFGGSAQPGSSVFGGTTAASAFGGSGQTGSSSFGSTSAASAFGGTAGTSSSVFGGKAASAFGGSTQTGSSGFGGSIPSAFGGSGQTGSSVFSAATTQSAFGGSGQPGSSVFGAAITQSAFGGSGQTSSSGFGGITTASAVGGSGQTSSSVFGGTTAGSAFGGAGQTSSSVFGGTTTASAFGGSGQTSSSVFGGTTAGPAFGGSGQSSSSIFGGTTVTSATAGSGQSGSSVFSSSGHTNFSGFVSSGQSGSRQTESPGFGGTAHSSSSAFGGTVKSTSSVFGGTATSSSAFGGSGASAVFGGANQASSSGFSGTEQRQAAVGQQGQGLSSSASTTTTNVFGRTSKSSASTVFGGAKTTSSPPSLVVTEEKGKRLNPPKTTFITKPTSSHLTPSVFGGQPSKSEHNLFGKNAEDEPGGAAVGFSRSNIDTTTGRSKSTTGLFGKQDAPVKNRLFGKETVGPSETRKTGRNPSDDSDEAPRAKKTMLRRLSSVVDDKVSIVCKNVPPKYNNAKILKTHFSKYGAVKRVVPNPNRRQAIIHFNTHEEAAAAKRQGKMIQNDMKPMEIYFGRYGSTALFGAQKRGEESTSRSLDPVKRQSDDNARSGSSKWPKSEIDDELSSMSGTSDISRETMRTLERKDEVKSMGSPSRPSRNLSPVTRTRQSSPAPATPSSSAEDVKIGKDSLRKLNNSVAHTLDEKIQILKLRDRIIRHGRKKQSSLVTAAAFVGTCPDMCPEMERYDREQKRRLHAFEILQGVDLPAGQNPRVDHIRAVKEYSRSSADQEEPLPHELRPMPVLMMTMNYLLSEIADRGSDGTWGDWFDFLWNRMRGIRKEITQQQLCDTNTAELLEKCVRFHIFCAERLCEEDMFSFDAKINNENMTKCLQTLKEIYHDLMKKHNIFCHNEAEIRAYMILMNLNEGDILRETQQLRAEVRNSAPIRFALQVYSALNSNNYVRFFRLVQVDSYLNACIMHRYFTQVRGRALRRILYTCGKGEHQYPIDNLVRILAFEDNREAADFCKFYGLRANTEIVHLNRANFIQPEENWLPRRAERLIESKRLVSVGEVINGEALQPLTLPQPSCSFNEQGKFIANLGLTAADMTDSPAPAASISSSTVVDAALSVSRITPSQPPPPYPGQSKSNVKLEQAVVPKKSFKFTNDDVKECAKILFWEVIDEFCNQTSREVHRDVQTYLDQGEAIVQSLLDEVVKENVDVLSRAFFNEIQTLRQKQLKQEREAMMKRVMVGLVSDLIIDTTKQEVLNLATAEVRAVKAELKEQQKARCSIDISEVLVEEVVSELVQTVSADVYQKDVVERLEQLADIEKCVQLQVAGRFLQIWKKEYNARLKLKRGMLTFPSGPGMASASEQVNMLIPDRREDGIKGDSFFVSQDGRLSLMTPVQLSDQRWVSTKLLSAHELYQNLCHCKAWQPFDIVKLIGDNVARIMKRKLKGKLPPYVYWKLLLSLPDPDGCDRQEEKHAAGHLNSWLRSKFTKGSKVRDQDGVLSLYKADLTRGDDRAPSRLCVCVRAVEGDDLDTGRQGVEDLMGVSGMILALPPGMEDNPKSTYWKRVRRRLDQILKVKPLVPPVSLVILCPVTPDQSTVTDDLVQNNIMDKYLDLSQVSNVYILDIDYKDDLEKGFDLDSLSLCEELGEAVEWLGEQYPPPPRLCVTYMKDLIDTNMQSHFHTPVLHNLKQRKIKGCLHQRPSDLLTLYNAIVHHLSQVVSSQRMMELSWPVPEFNLSNSVQGLPKPYWNDESHLEYIHEVMSQLELPWLQDIDLENTNWSEVCDEIWAFVRSVAGDDTGSARVDLVSKIRLLLKKVKQDFEDTCYLMEGENRCEPSFENVPWTDVISACIEYRMASVDFTDPQAEDKEQDSELMVVYFEEDLKNYRPPPSWTYLENERDLTGLPSLNATVKAAVEKVQEARIEQSQSYDNTQNALVSSTADSFIDLDIMSQEDMATQRKTCHLIETVKAERRESQKFDQYLERVLNECDFDSKYKTFDRNSPVLGVSYHSPTPELWDRSGIEPSIFLDCTPQKFSAGIGEQSLMSIQGLFDTSSALPSGTTAEVGTGNVSDSLTKLQQEIASYRRSSDVFEQQLKFWIDN